MIEIDCQAGGGGILRAALSLALFYKKSIRLINFRINRLDKGIGGPHLSLINEICKVTKSDTERVYLQSTDFEFHPEQIKNNLNLNLNFDNSKTTIKKFDIKVEKDFKGVEDNFKQNINNINGKMVRGHSIVTPIIAFIPIMLFHGKINIARLVGGTETPGAPFLDTFTICHQSFFQSINANIDYNIKSRGCIGIGGGEVYLNINRINKLKPFNQKYPVKNHDILIFVKVYIYGDVSFQNKIKNEIKEHIIALEIKIKYKVDIEYIEEIYEKNMYQLLFIIKNGFIYREIPIVYEELNEKELNTFGMKKAYRRILYEINNSHLFSRFHIDAILPILAMISGSSRIYTDSISSHLKSVIITIEKISNRNVKVNMTSENYIEIYME